MAFRSRRALFQHGVGLLALLGLELRGLLGPAPARASVADWRFSARQIRTLVRLGEVLVPGSGKAGLARFIQAQLSGRPENSLLMIKYLGIPGNVAEFYGSGLDGLDRAARSLHSRPFDAISPQDAVALATSLAKGEIKDWMGPPAPLFFFVLRNDAVDVKYGTQAGFESLGVPYMPHIAPPAEW